MIKTKVWYYAGFLLYLLIHVLTLSISPLPWFDETFFASISKSLSESGKFVPLIASSAFEGREFFMQGPIYYLLCAGVFKLSGFGIFQFRLTALLFGIGVIIISGLILSRQLGKKHHLLNLFPMVFMLDPFLNLSMHEGRMDTVCLFLFLSSIYILGSESKYRFLLSGLLASLAALTTLRIALLFPVFLVILYRDFINRKYKGLAVWIPALAIPYIFWIACAFGTISSFMQYYIEANAGLHSVDKGYIGGNFYVPKHEYFIIALSIVTLIVSICFDSKSVKNRYTIMCLTAIGCFYILIHDLGPYSVFIIPFYYLLFFNQISGASINSVRTFLLMALFAFNTGFFLLRNIYVKATHQYRNQEVASQFVSQHIPMGSRVVGDAVYYYAATESGCEFQYMDKFIDLPERETRHRTEWNYQYAIVSDIERARYPEALAYYRKKGSWVKLARLDISAGNETSRLIERMGILSSHERSGYSATIYKRSE